MNENCEGPRVLCLSCTVSKDQELNHKDHNLVLIEEFNKKIECVKASKPNTTQMMMHMSFDMSNEKLLELYEVLQTLLGEMNASDHSSNQRHLNGDTLIKEESGKEKETLPSQNEGPLYLNKNSSTEEQYIVNKEGVNDNTMSNDNLHSRDYRRELKPPRRVISSKNNINKDAIKFSIGTNSEFFTSQRLPNELLDPVIDELKYPEQKKSKILKFTDSIKNQPKMQASSYTTKKLQYTASSCKMAESLIQNNLSKAELLGIRDLQNQPDLNDKSPHSRAAKENSNVSQIVKSGMKITSKGKVTVFERQSEKATPPLRAIDQLRNALERFNRTCSFEDLENSLNENKKEEFLNIKPDYRKSPSIYACDVYQEDQIAETADSLWKDSTEIAQSELQHELTKQVTGFKEFCAFTTNSNKNIKPKELKQMWKDLPKIDREQWNSIALRKRIELRDKIEVQKKIVRQI